VIPDGPLAFVIHDQRSGTKRETAEENIWDLCGRAWRAYAEVAAEPVYVA
jgi:hypothetical protein